MIRHLGPACLLLAVACNAAADTQVISPGPDAVSITIYRDLFALITETRSVDLPAEAHTLSFDGVVETLIPASAVAANLQRELDERNYDYDQLAPSSLLRKSVGKAVTITRTYPGSGKVRQVRAIIESAQDSGVTLRTQDGLEALSCSGIPEGLTFEEIPEGLHPEPRLSIRLKAGTPGKRTIKLSYIAQGFAWSSNYVAHLARDGNTFDLTGWVTLQNLTHASFRQAQVSMVAGRLNLLDEDDGGSSSFGATGDFADENETQGARQERLYEMREELESFDELTFLHGCYPMGAPNPVPVLKPQAARYYGDQFAYAQGSGEFEEVVVTGVRASLAPPEALADYHLYRIPWPTDLNARQVKQAVFLQKPRVKADYFYSGQLTEDDFDQSGTPVKVQAKLAFDNKRSDGLGEPLPGGMFRAFAREAAGDIFLGETTLDDKATGLPVELTLGGALDLALELQFEEMYDEDVFEDDSDFFDVALLVSNAKPRPISLEIRQTIPEDEEWVITGANHRTGRKHGDYVWRWRIDANSRDSLTYRMVEKLP